MIDFQNVLSCISSGVIRSSCMSFQTQSIHLPLGLPLGLFPGTIMSITALTSLFSSILCMCPYQRSLISLTFSLMLFTRSSFLMSTLFTLSFSVTSIILPTSSSLFSRESVLPSLQLSVFSFYTSVYKIMMKSIP